MMLFLVMFLGCSSQEEVPVVVEPTVEPAPLIEKKKPEVIGVQKGVQHPPIPADSPAWRHDPGGFVPDVHFYGERNWDDVRMRVAGHIAIIERDRARIEAMSGRFEQAAKVYSALEKTLTQMIPPTGGPASEIPTVARDAARRDAALMSGLHTGHILVEGDGFARLRAEYLSLAIVFRKNPNGLALRAETTDLMQRIQRFGDTGYQRFDHLLFEDFDGRHTLRVRLWRQHLDSADPVGLDEPWGHFTESEVHRQIGALYAATALLSRQEPDMGVDWTGSWPNLQSVDPVYWPSEIARSKTMKDQAASFSVQGIGRLPTGDTLIDVGGEPGPGSIGKLERLGLDDPVHLQWLEDTVFVLNKMMKDQPGGLVSLIKSRTDYLGQMKHGSRYYNIKQLRNAGVRQLARGGHARLARQVLALNFPLHHQDWECPNREGILVAIDGRLAVAGRQPDAETQLAEARRLSDAFLAEISKVQR
jgi:hypothetical protein